MNLQIEDHFSEKRLIHPSSTFFVYVCENVLVWNWSLLVNRHVKCLRNWEFFWKRSIGAIDAFCTISKANSKLSKVKKKRSFAFYGGLREVFAVSPEKRFSWASSKLRVFLYYSNYWQSESLMLKVIKKKILVFCFKCILVDAQKAVSLSVRRKFT